jgi:hypothetical protein
MTTSLDATGPRSDAGTRLVGNRLVLVGAVLYLLEWVAIIAASVDAPLGGTASTAELHSAYTGHVQGYAWAAGWFSVVLLGRILLVSGLRTALTQSGRPQPLMDLALGAMAVSVVLEVTTYALVAGTAWTAGTGGSTGAVRALDAAAFLLSELIFGPLGVSLVCAGAAMWLSGLFPRVLSGLALLGGLAGVLGAAAFVSPRFGGLTDSVTSVTAAAFWIWMLWTGVLLWRARPAAGSRLA